MNEQRAPCSLVLLREILYEAGVPFSEGGGPATVSSKGIGGSWALLAEASQLPGFRTALRQLVTATYPRPPSLRSGLDTVLQRLFVEAPELVGPCCVGPVLDKYADAAARAAAVGGACVSKAQLRRERKKANKAKRKSLQRAGVQGAEAAEAQAVDTEAESEGGGLAEEEGCIRAAAKARTPSAEPQQLGHPGASAAATPDFSAYDSRQLPASWLLQCFGAVPPMLRCLWAPDRQQALRAHILAAAAHAFGRHHTRTIQPSSRAGGVGGCAGGDDSAPAAAGAAPTRIAVAYIAGSPVVQFARDCLLATPPGARLQLLRDAMRLARAHQPDACADADAAVATAGAGEAGAADGAAGTALSPPHKRRRVANGDTLSPTPGPHAAPANANANANDAAEAAGAPLPWAALLAHICEEEEAARRRREAAAAAAARRAPAERPGGALPGPRVVPPEALAELLLSQGDLFIPADAACVAPTLLRFLPTLQPAEAGPLLARVLACPAAVPGAPGACDAAPAAVAAAAATGAAAAASGGCVAVLATLRWPLPRPEEMLLPPPRDGPGHVGTAEARREGDGLAAAAQQGRKRGRQGTQASGATEPSPSSPTPTPTPPSAAPAAPPPLTPLWLLTHVLPTLLRPLECTGADGDGEGGDGDDGGGEGGDGERREGGDDGASLHLDGDEGAGARAIAALGQLLRHPRLVLPEEDPEQLRLAAAVMALKCSKLGGGGATADGSASDGGGSGGGGGGSATGGEGSWPQYALAAALCGAFGLAGSTPLRVARAPGDTGSGDGGGDGGGEGGDGLALVDALTSHVGIAAERLAGLAIATAAAANTAAAPAWLVRHEEPQPVATEPLAQPAAPQSTAQPAPRSRQPAAPVPLPVPAAFTPLWPAIRPLLALLEHLSPAGPLAAALHTLLLTALLQQQQQQQQQPSDDGGTAAIAAAPRASGERTPTPGGASSAPAGVTAAPTGAAAEVLALLVDGATGPLPGHTAAMQLSPPVRLDLLRVLLLAEDAAARRAESAATAAVLKAGAEGGGGAGGRSESLHHEAAAPTGGSCGSGGGSGAGVGGGTTAGDGHGCDAGASTGPRLAPLVLERLTASIQSVHAALHAPAAASTAATVATAALTRVAQEALLVRLAAAVAVPPPATGTPLGLTAGTGATCLAAAGRSCAVRLLRGCPAALCVLRRAAERQPAAVGAPVAAAAGAAAGGLAAGLAVRRVGPQLVMETQVALRALAEAVAFAE